MSAIPDVLIRTFGAALKDAGHTLLRGSRATSLRTALNERNERIAGPYAAGSCAGGLDGGPHAGYVGGLAKAAATGLRTADHLAAALQKPL